MDQKERALKKLQTELNKDIKHAIIMAKECGLLELIYFIYKLHWVRLLPFLANIDQMNKDLVNAFANSTEDSVKYIISLISKFGNWGLKITKEDKKVHINIPLLEEIQRHCNYINSKYEMEPLINLFEVSVSGKRDQHIKIDTSLIDSNSEIKSFFDYFVRIDEDNQIKKSSKKNQQELLKNFKEEYSQFSDLFLKEIGVSVDDYCFLINKLLCKVTDCLKIKEKEFIKLENGNVNLSSFHSFLISFSCFLFPKSELFKEFDIKFHPIIEKFIFNSEFFNENQLRFHHVTRQPLIANSEYFIISPELILDSVFSNIHYSLLESPLYKDEYIARQASSFIDKLVNIASSYGYEEIDREFDLKEGKNKIGDIDLILKHKDGRYLLIEAKNHALPLDIYFKDFIKTKEHLDYLQSKWEIQVKRRIEHLRINFKNYSIPLDFEYIVVSRYPEIISHFSDLFILSIQEFQEWLSQYSTIKSFNDFYHLYYEHVKTKFSEKEMDDLRKANILFGKFKEK